MQTKIIANYQFYGNIKEKDDGRLYFFRKGATKRAAYINIKYNGGLSISITFNSLMNIAGMSVQGKTIKPSRIRNIQITKRYDVDVSYDNEDKESYSLGEVSRK